VANVDTYREADRAMDGWMTVSQQTWSMMDGRSKQASRCRLSALTVKILVNLEFGTFGAFGTFGTFGAFGTFGIVEFGRFGRFRIFGIFGIWNFVFFRTFGILELLVWSFLQ